MKKFFIISSCVVSTVLVFLYLVFLFVVPKLIILDNYKADIQKLVKENTNLDIDYKNIKIITTPLLEAGIKIDDVSLKLPDGSILFYTNFIEGKLFLPQLLLKTVNVSEVKVEKPWINLYIKNGEEFTAVRAYEDLVNFKRKDKLQHPEKYVKIKEKADLPIDLAQIKFKLPNIKINDYQVKIVDIKTNHRLILFGDNLTLGYNNGKTGKIKTNAQFYSDKEQNITANIDIDTILPKIKLPEKEEEDLEAVYKIPFVNPVEIYRDYNLKSNINSKLRIRKNKRNNFLRMNGFFNIEDTTLTMSGLELPKSYLKLKAKNSNVDIDTNIYVTDKEYVNLSGNVNYAKPYVDLTLKSSQVHLSNVLDITKAYIKTLNLKTDIDNINAGGYFLANAQLKTNFADIISKGKIIIRNGFISDKNLGLLLGDIKANFVLDNNIFKVSDTHIMINKRPLDIAGQVSADSVANFHIKGDKIPLMLLYKAFAPKELKNSYDIVSGFLSLDAKVSGDVKDLAAILKTDLEDFILNDKKNTFTLKNKKLHFGIANYQGMIRGKLTNTGFGFAYPSLRTFITDDLMTVNIDNKTVKIEPSVMKFNRQSAISFNGQINNYLTAFNANLSADGKIAASDLGIVAGEVVLPYMDLKGSLPIKVKANAEKNKFDITAQVMADRSNYITPLVIEDLVNNQTIAQLNINKKNDTLKIEKTGIFSKKSDEFGDNFSKNIRFAKQIADVKGIISNVNFQPFISLFKISVPKDLNGSIYIFSGSKFTFNGRLQAFGRPQSPHINGNFVIKDFVLPQALIKIDRIIADIGTKEINFDLNNIDANGSNFKISGKTKWNLLPQMTIYDVNVMSRFIDVNKLIKLTEVVTKNFPTSEPNREIRGIEQRTQFPFQVLNGNINFHRIVMDKILINNTTARIAVLKNILYVSDLKTNPMGGIVTGKAQVDIIKTVIAAQVSGRQFDIEKILLDVMGMKDMLTGQMNFIADIKLQGTQLEEQLHSLKGTVDFNIKKGQLGPFGKFENFLMAENIRENQFFSTAIGSIIKNILSFDTSRFNELYGHLSFNDGVAEISPIKSQGNVMSMFIFGNLNLLDNSAELKVRGKLASAFSDSLGPLANINPINLVKHTPGLNIVLAKSFSIFCESLSEEEMNAIPSLAEGKSHDNATKFQIRLKGDTRKPLKMIKSFKWLALDSEIESAQKFVDTIPTPEEGEEGLTVEELIELRAQQAAAEAEQKAKDAKKPINRIRKIFGYQPK